MPMTRNIDNEQEFNRIRTAGRYDYTIDDFIEMLRVSERTMKDLLENIDHISISRGLYLNLKKKYGDSINRQQFYNREYVIRELVKSRRVVFKLNYIPHIYLESERVFDKQQNEVESIEVFPSIVFKYKDYFYSLLETAGGTTDIKDRFKGNKRQLNREVKRIEGIEINISKNTKRYMPLMIEHNLMDALINYVLVAEVIELQKKHTDK